MTLTHLSDGRHQPLGTANALIFEADRPTRVLVFTPALGVRADYYNDFARALNRERICVVINELRGHGTSRVRPGRGVDFGYPALINEDLKAVMDFVDRTFHGVPMILGGHSLGGQLAALYAARYQPRLEGILLIACSSPYHRGFPASRGRTIYWGSHLIQAVSGLLGYFPGRTFGFGGREARGLMNDWARIARHNVFNFDRDPFDYDGTLAALGCPVLGLCFPADTYAPLCAMRQFTDKLPQNRLRIEVLDALAFQKTDHFSWIRQGNELAPILGDWLAWIMMA